MSGGNFLSIKPSELKFQFELKKQSSCSLDLSNKTGNKTIAFKVKTTNPKKYCVRPNSGIVVPGGICVVSVTMQAQKEAPPDLQCKDKFLLQSVEVPDFLTAKDITPEMFNKEDGKVIDEFKLRVSYIPVNPPSPVPEGSEEGSSPKASPRENGNQSELAVDPISRSVEEPKDKSAEAWSTIAKLKEEKSLALEQNQKLERDLELMRKEVSKNGASRFSLFFVFVVAVLGILVGYVVK